MSKSIKFEFPYTNPIFHEIKGEVSANKLCKSGNILKINHSFIFSHQNLRDLLTN